MSLWITIKWIIPCRIWLRSVHVERDDAHHRVRIIGFDLGQVAGCRDWLPSLSSVSTHPLAASGP